jgi:protein TonB
MPNSMVSTNLPAESAAFERRSLLHYGLVLAISAALHFVIWQFRGVLEQRPEPKPKPVQTIEVMLTPSPAPAATGPEPGPEKSEAKKAEPNKSEPKPVAIAKPAPPQRPKLEPKPKPKPKPTPKPAIEPDPNPVREARPEPKPVAPSREMERPAPVHSETSLSRETEAPAPRASQSSEAAEGTATKPHSGESGKAGGSQGPADEGPTTKAAYLYRPEPEYPAIAKHRQWEGRVVIRVKVLANGHCSQAEIQASSGHDILDEAARETVCNTWRFKPALRGGQPVESTVNVPINFKLE